MERKCTVRKKKKNALRIGLKTVSYQVAYVTKSEGRAQRSSKNDRIDGEDPRLFTQSVDHYAARSVLLPWR